MVVEVKTYKGKLRNYKFKNVRAVAQSRYSICIYFHEEDEGTGVCFNNDEVKNILIIGFENESFN